MLLGAAAASARGLAAARSTEACCRSSPSSPRARNTSRHGMPACRSDHRVGLVGLGFLYAALAARWSHGPCRSPPSKPGLSERASGATLAPQLCAATPLRARGCGSGRCAVRSRAHLLERDLDLRRVRRGRHERSEGARLVRPALRSAQRGAERPATRQGHRAPNPTRSTDSRCRLHGLKQRQGRGCTAAVTAGVQAVATASAPPAAADARMACSLGR
jgi:hypothetical protein